MELLKETIINMRGQNHSAIDMKVKVMIDGVPINTIMSPQGFNTIPVATIEKIEILQKWSSSLWW